MAKGKSEQQKVAAFNKSFPVGTQVKYWKGLKEGAPTGTGATRSEAELLGGHTAVVWVEGCTGAVALSHVEVAR